MFTLFVRKHVDVTVLWIKFFLYVFLSTSLSQGQFLKALPTLTGAVRKKSNACILFIYCSISDPSLQTSIWHYALV